MSIVEAISEFGRHSHFLSKIFPPPFLSLIPPSFTCSYLSTQSRPKLRVVEPIDYESELSSRRKELGKEKYLGLMLFPQNDVEVIIWLTTKY